MSWSGPAEPTDRSGGGRRKRARGPRWVTDEAREIAGRQQAASRSDRKQPPPVPQPPASQPRASQPPRRTPPPPPSETRYQPPPRRTPPPPPSEARYQPPPIEPRRQSHSYDEPRRPSWAADERPAARDHDRPYSRDDAYDRGYDARPHDRDRYDGDRRRDERHVDRDPHDRGRHDRDRHVDRYDAGPYDRDDRRHDRDRDRPHPRSYDRDHDRDQDRNHDRSRDRGRDHDDWDRDDDPTRPYESDRDTVPRKLTVVRVAAWRSKQLTGRGLDAFRRATTADGADRSGLTALTYPTMLNYGADAAIAVALANTLFFSAATAESKMKVALYLLITIAPFALIAPVIGPLLDRLQRGRRVALAASFAGRIVLAIVMAQHFDDWLLYPAALGVMVLSRSFNVLKAAVTPRVLPPDITLTKTNSRLAVFGLAAGGVIGAIAAGFAALFGSAGALWFMAVVCAAGVYVCIRIPSWVEVTEGEVPASLRDRGDDDPDAAEPGRRRREPLGKHVVVALWGNGTIRVLTGFLTLFVAFVVKAQTEQSSPWAQVYLLGLVGVAAGAGSVAGNALGARQQFDKPDQVIVTCVAVVLGATLLATAISGITTAVVVALVGSVCSALAKVCLDATTQSDMSEESRASAFGRTETILQLSWTFGGALGVLLPPTYWLGFAVVSVVLALGLAQTVMTHRGGTIIPRFGGDRPARSARAGLGRLRRARAERSDRAAPSSRPDGPTEPPALPPGSDADPAPTRRWEHNR